MRRITLAWKLGHLQSKFPPLTQGEPANKWVARKLNEIFETWGVTKEKGNILPCTVRHGLRYTWSGIE